ncbi:CpsD/CapB family tyrosine-protein kinase [Carnobacterium maltaromaticum]|uniref:Tyrosine-protein kinase CpsD n=1 Tax=Carnobacterium maltaromaticum TaxID=2751 RepID=A0AAW9JWT4_CARML|nr:CpsD/CapB family tyrosine-protein kinase [Carnobacterium maltaromaticum]MDZ5759759.1 CpsD/CapB family tyrosine-protein kinase [Carnobacterium maltaromaticum]
MTVLNDRRQLITQTNPNSIISEQFKTIRTGIDFAGVDEKIKTLLITSPEVETGKSTISANLAIVFAQKGLRTLLIDGDMRKPTVHKTFDKNMNIGLSNSLTEDIDIVNCCQRTTIRNLFILTCGVIPPNPNELLGSRRMKVALDRLKKNFDRIIIDTPPVMVVSDALVLAPNTDGVILVIRDNETLKDRAKQALEQIKITKTPVIGAILNGVSEKENSPYYHVYK